MRSVRSLGVGLRPEQALSLKRILIQLRSSRHHVLSQIVEGDATCKLLSVQIEEEALKELIATLERVMFKEDADNFELTEDDHEFVMIDGELSIDGFDISPKQVETYRKARDAWRVTQ